MVYRSTATCAFRLRDVRHRAGRSAREVSAVETCGAVTRNLCEHARRRMADNRLAETPRAVSDVKIGCDVVTRDASSSSSRVQSSGPSMHSPPHDACEEERLPPRIANHAVSLVASVSKRAQRRDAEQPRAGRRLQTRRGRDRDARVPAYDPGPSPTTISSAFRSAARLAADFRRTDPECLRSFANSLSKALGCVSRHAIDPRPVERSSARIFIRVQSANDALGFALHLERNPVACSAGSSSREPIRPFDHANAVAKQVFIEPEARDCARRTRAGRNRNDKPGSGRR